MNVEIGTEAVRAIPRKGIHKWDFCCSVRGNEPVPGIPVPEEYGAVLTPGHDVAVGGDVALRPRQKTGVCFLFLTS